MRILLAGVGAIVVAGAAIAVAQPGTGGPGGRRDVVSVQAQLGLNDEQAAQLRKLHAAERKEAIRRHADTAIARMELDEALNAPTVDEKLVAAKAKAVADLQAASVQARVDQRLAVRKLLTPEQQAKMSQLMRDHRAGRRAHRGVGRQGPGRRGGPMGAGRGPGGSGAPADAPGGQEE
jgi:Spy/CpxP family protein refolding chaperone